MVLFALSTACSTRETPFPSTSDDERFLRVPKPAAQVPRLNSERVFVVASDTFTSLVPLRPIVVGRDDGAMIVASPGNSSLVTQLDATGRLIGVVGARGDGPGEYRSVSDLSLLIGDTLLVSGAQRLSLFAPSGEFVRRVQAQSVVVLRGARTEPSGRLIVGGFHRTEQANQAPFHVIDFDGFLVESVGDASPARALYSARELPRVVNKSATGPMLYAEEAYYVLRMLGSDGTDSLAFSMDSDEWLGTGIASAEEAADAPPNVNYALTMRALELGVPRVWRRITSIAAASDSAVWVTVMREKTGWERVARTFRYALPNNQGERSESDEADDQLYETVVHLWSLRSPAQLLGELILPYRAELARPGILVHSSYTSSGDTRLEVLQLTQLNRREK